MSAESEVIAARGNTEAATLIRGKANYSGITGAQAGLGRPHTSAIRAGVDADGMQVAHVAGTSPSRRGGRPEDWSKQGRLWRFLDNQWAKP